MGKQDAKRVAIFERFAANFRLLSDTEFWEFTTEGEYFRNVDLYVCPLCFNAYTKESIYPNEQQNIDLTIEHVPPAAVGGKPIVLTCKQCNNENGTNLDIHIKNRLEFEQFLTKQPDSSIPGILKINNKSIRSKWGYRADKLKLDVNSKSNPYLESEIIHILKHGRQFQFTFKEPSKRNTILALVKSAYLKAFSYLGYAFAFNENIIETKNHIYSNSENISERIVIWNKTPTTDLIPNIGILKSPKDYMCFVVFMDIKINNQTQRFAVAFPGPFKEGRACYENLCLHQTKQKEINMDIEILRDNLDPSNSDDLFSYYKIWTQYRQ